MASISTLWFLKLRLYAKLRLFNVKFHFGHKISYSRLRLIQPALIQPASLTSHFDLVHIFMKGKKHFGYYSQLLITATLARSRGGWFKRSLLYLKSRLYFKLRFVKSRFYCIINLLTLR